MNDKQEEFNKALSGILGNMAKTFDDERDFNKADMINAILSQFKSLPSAAMFDRKILTEDRLTLSRAIRHLFDRENVPSEIQWKIVPLFENYDFYKNHLRKKISDFEGSACCVDKVHLIVNLYCSHQRLLANNESLFETDRSFHEWNLPVEGSLEKWFNVLEGLTYFRSGHTDQYLSALADLTKFYEDYAQEAAENVPFINSDED